MCHMLCKSGGNGKDLDPGRYADVVLRNEQILLGSRPVVRRRNYSSEVTPN